MDGVPDKIVLEWTIDKVMDHWPQGEIEPNFVDIISACRGWSPLEKYQKMRINYDNKEYSIMRHK